MATHIEIARGNDNCTDDVLGERSLPSSRKPMLYIVLSIVELLIGGGFFALLPLFFSIVYKLKAEQNPRTFTKWVALSLLLVVFLYGVFCNLYTLATLFLTVE